MERLSKTTIQTQPWIKLFFSLLKNDYLDLVGALWLANYTDDRFNLKVSGTQTLRLIRGFFVSYIQGMDR